MEHPCAQSAYRFKFTADYCSISNLTRRGIRLPIFARAMSKSGRLMSLPIFLCSHSPAFEPPNPDFLIAWKDSGNSLANSNGLKLALEKPCICVPAVITWQVLFPRETLFYEQAPILTGLCDRHGSGLSGLKQPDKPDPDSARNVDESRERGWQRRSDQGRHARALHHESIRPG